MYHDHSKPRRSIFVGDLLDGRYQIEAELGGGFGWRGYLARHQTLDRLITVEVLKTDDSRLDEEVSAIANIDHPNLVNVYDIGYLDDHALYVVTQRLEGCTLREFFLGEGPLSAPQALEICKKILSALSSLHARGLVHGDIQPETIFLNHPQLPFENVLILGFGFAHAPPTRGKTVEPSPDNARYQPPEFLERRITTPARDVYAVALMLLEMLTARALPQSSTGQGWSSGASKRGQVDIPSALRASPLAPVLEKALAQDPRHRYPDASFFLEDIERMNEAWFYEKRE